MKIGSANYNQRGSKKHYHKLAKGEGVVGVFRIVPPIGDLADKGIWAIFYKVHYGYRNSENRMKLFLSPEVVNRSSRMIEVEDAAKRRIDNLRAKYSEARNSGNQEAANGLKELLRTFNLENRWHMNAIDLSGKIGLLKLPHTAKKDLDNEIKKLTAKGVDPLSVDQGRFFAIIRNIDGQKVTYKVQVYKEEVETKDYGKVEKDVVHALGDDIISRLSVEAFELDKLYKAPSSDQVERIVKEGKSAVDEILGSGNASAAASSSKTENSAQFSEEDDVPSDEDLDNLAEEASASSAKAVTPAAARPQPAPASVKKPEPAVGGLKIGKATSSTESKDAVEAKVTNEKIKNMSSEDFLAALENGTL